MAKIVILHLVDADSTAKDKILGDKVLGDIFKRLEGFTKLTTPEHSFMDPELSALWLAMSKEELTVEGIRRSLKNEKVGEEAKKWFLKTNAETQLHHKPNVYYEMLEEHKCKASEALKLLQGLKEMPCFLVIVSHGSFTELSTLGQETDSLKYSDLFSFLVNSNKKPLSVVFVSCVTGRMGLSDLSFLAPTLPEVFFSGFGNSVNPSVIFDSILMAYLRFAVWVCMHEDLCPLERKTVLRMRVALGGIFSAPDINNLYFYNDDMTQSPTGLHSSTVTGWMWNQVQRSEKYKINSDLADQLLQLHRFHLFTSGRPPKHREQTLRLFQQLEKQIKESVCEQKLIEDITKVNEAYNIAEVAKLFETFRRRMKNIHNQTNENGEPVERNGLERNVLAVCQECPGTEKFDVALKNIWEAYETNVDTELTGAALVFACDGKGLYIPVNETKVGELFKRLNVQAAG
ncbi:hypothetical protein BKA69DRAFT_1104820 [Paraphysoderma sedebokerense]|nr:hypothetical protein BKA69DRAFT_1104820 [Paraphysoderma sedebokerense]